MKTIRKILGGIILCAFTFSLNAQQTWDAKKNSTVDSISSPFESKLLPPPASITIQDIFPVIGTYESSTNTDATLVSISLDEQNKGLIWIEGLPQGKIKAMLRKSPATYKIPEQKTEAAMTVSEGTLIFDNDMKSLSIIIGKSYNATEPEAAFLNNSEKSDYSNTQSIEKSNTKKGNKDLKTEVQKPKPWVYTGTKVEKTTALNN